MHKEIYARVKKPVKNPITTETIGLNIEYIGLGMYREWKEIEFPKDYYI